MYQTAALPIAARPAAPLAGEALDAHLLAGVARRDHAAFEQCYARHVVAVTKTALNVCRNHAIAEEIAQQAFTALWERADRLHARSVRLRPWITTVARNAAIDRLRSGDDTIVALDEIEERPSTEAGPDAAVVATETSAEVERALAVLPAEQRAVVTLIYFQGMTAQEAAVATNAPVGTVKSRLRLALGHLRANLQTVGV